MDITLICVGKLKEKFYQEAAAEYAKRLKGYCKLSIVELAEQRLSKNPSLGEIQGALEKEGDAIRSKIPPNSSVIALAVEGTMRSSEELAAMVSGATTPPSIWCSSSAGPTGCTPPSRPGPGPPCPCRP